MANVVINDTNLTAIAEAIREKNGTTETYKPSEMAAAIKELKAGGLESILSFSGDCSYLFYKGQFDKLIENYGDSISTSEITKAYYMFSESSLTEIPFVINLKDANSSTSVTEQEFNYMFYGCTNLKKAPVIAAETKVASNLDYLYMNCNNLNDTLTFDWVDWDTVHTTQTNSLRRLFYNCYSLRSIPESELKNIYNAAINTSTGQPFSPGAFTNCYALDEVRGLYPPPVTYTTNMFSNSFDKCGRVKDIVFVTDENGLPFVREWKNQTIKLNYYLGYALSGDSEPTKHNSGITADKKVTDATTYEALKNDADWWSTMPGYSRYNHDSAVNTINSLPDTSAYVSANGGTNTIYFNGVSGSLTDSGAINTLTEEEIAVATAKGWTVSF